MELEWQKGEPDKSGYYLVAWRTDTPSPQQRQTVVSELWFNPDAPRPWWFTRGYASQLRRGGLSDALHHEVVAWMPMPDPPEDW